MYLFSFDPRLRLYLVDIFSRLVSEIHLSRRGANLCLVSLTLSSHLYFDACVRVHDTCYGYAHWHIGWIVGSESFRERVRKGERPKVEPWVTLLPHSFSVPFSLSWWNRRYTTRTCTGTLRPRDRTIRRKATLSTGSSIMSLNVLPSRGKGRGKKRKGNSREQVGIGS